MKRSVLLWVPLFVVFFFIIGSLQFLPSFSSSSVEQDTILNNIQKESVYITKELNNQYSKEEFEEIPNTNTIETWYSFWTGPIDESLLVCWFYHHINPKIRQVFYFEDVPDFDEYKERYPFLKEIEVIEINWDLFLSSTDIDYDPKLVDRIKNEYDPPHKADIFRYILIFKNNGTSYMDADQCFFDFTKTNNIDFYVRIVRDNGKYISNGVFKATDEKHVASIQEEFRNDFLPGKTFMTFNINTRNAIGPLYLTNILKQAKIINTNSELIQKNETENINLFNLSEIYGWAYDSPDTLCDVWNKSIHGSGIHLYSGKRAQYADKLKQLLQKSIQYNEIVQCK